MCVTSNGRKFGGPIRPQISSKNKQTGYVVLTDDKDNIVSHPEKVASMFNENFIDVAESIGNPDEVNEDTDTQSVVQRHSNHTSITWIKENVDTRSQFKFQYVTSDEVKKKMSKINSKTCSSITVYPPYVFN